MMSKLFLLAELTLSSLLCLATALALDNCAWDKVNPAIYAPVAGNPCGNVETECADHGCCNADLTTCGGDNYPGCPAGMCCDIATSPAFEGRYDRDASTSRKRFERYPDAGR
jgi:hypothetical protein